MTQFNTFKVCLGSNCTEAADNISSAVQFLSHHSRLTAMSPRFETPSEGNTEAPDYVNMVIEGQTEFDYHQWVALCKKYETECRNKDNGKPLIVTIDIDTVEFNGEIKRPSDASSAHYTAGLQKLKNN